MGTKIHVQERSQQHYFSSKLEATQMSTHKLWHMSSPEYHKEIKMHKQLLHATAWTNLTTRLLSKEVRHKRSYTSSKIAKLIFGVKVNIMVTLWRVITERDKREASGIQFMFCILSWVTVTCYVLCSVCENSLNCMYT